ncbi:MAG: sulfatase family protein [Planctomycetota bacterium]|jgi:arylsulfatase A-like enzyme
MLCSRREFLRRAGTVTLAGTLLLEEMADNAWSRSPGARPNIIFIFADDHASEAISAYGSYLKDYARTPNIDRLAREGMLFRNCLCNNSICSPSRASVLTGQYSHKNGVRGLNGTINENSPWFSAELQKAGYQTAVVGKWHLKSWPKGFDRFWVTKGQGRYFNPTFYTKPDGGKVSETGYSTDVYADYALRWLRQRDTEKPFLLCLHFKAPHHPYDYAQRHGKLLEGVKIPEPPNLYEDIAKTSPRLKNGRGQVMEDKSRNGYYSRHVKDKVPPMPPHNANNRKARVAAAYQHMMLKYIRCITANDEAVGRVLDFLDDNNLSDSTIVVYTADQGYWLGQHGLYDKRLILEESLRMPLLVRYPGVVKAGSVSEKIAMNNDFGPTFLDYAGAAIPRAMQGVSLRPLLESKPPTDWRTDAFYCYWSRPGHWGVRTERYTLAHFPRTDEFEFYDNQNDPWQMVNQANNPAYAEAVADCEQRLARLVREIDFSPGDYPGA